MNEVNPLNILKQRLLNDSLRAVAREIGVSAPYLHDIMKGKRRAGPKVLRALGIEREVVTTVTYRRQRTSKSRNQERS